MGFLDKKTANILNSVKATQFHFSAKDNGFSRYYYSFSIFAPSPQFSGCILFAPLHARARILHNDLQCNGTCSVTVGSLSH